jgi:hypothetical protein
VAAVVAMEAVVVAVRSPVVFLMFLSFLFLSKILLYIGYGGGGGYDRGGYGGGYDDRGRGGGGGECLVSKLHHDNYLF